jgi:hypothetical protein
MPMPDRGRERKGLGRFSRWLLAAVVASLALATATEAAWYDAGWRYRKSVTLNGGNCTVPVALCIPAAQTDFPVLLSFTDAHLGANAQADGDDILITSADGSTRLDHEIESYASPAGAIVAWVKVPALASGTNTTLYLYYGNAGAASQQNPTGVWSNGFLGVWHLREDPSGGAPQVRDSTSGARHATTAGGMTAGNQVVGQVNGSLTLDGVNDYAATASNTLMANLGAFTLSAWVRPAGAQPQYAEIVGHYDAVNDFSATLEMDGLAVHTAILSPGYTPLWGGALSTTDWSHVVSRYTGAALQIWVNGAQAATTGASGTLVNITAPIHIGFNPSDLRYLGGGIDEVRISGVSRSNSWLQTEYRNQANQGVGAGRFILALSGAETRRAIYYSVGARTTALYGPANASAAGGTLTLAGAAADNVGVGDEVRVGANRYYVTGRVSSTVFTIQNSGANGGTPGDTSITFGSQSISIYRAFNDVRQAARSYYGAWTGDANHLKTTDLVAGNYQLNWVCYDDGPMVIDYPVDGYMFEIDTYTTGPANYIRVYTPTSTGEVGVSQRHTGVFGTGFQLEGRNADTIRIFDNYVRIEGLTILATVTNNDNAWGGIWSVPDGPSDVRISDNIIKGNVTDAAGRRAYGIALGDWNIEGTTRVWNNVVYHFPVVVGSEGRCIDITYGTGYVFSNTVCRCREGISIQDSTALGGEIKNNVSINDVFSSATNTDYVGSIGTWVSNVSSDSTSETAALRNKTAYSSYFRNTTLGSEDLHLRNRSLNLWGANGADLSADPNIAVRRDIDGASRVSPDIGADEFAPPEVGTGCAAGTAPTGPNFVQHGTFDMGDTEPAGGRTGNNFTTSAAYTSFDCPGDTGATVRTATGLCGGTAVWISTFPGDPRYGIAATNNSLYGNGNGTGGPYIYWRQTVSGLQPSTTYTFFLYGTNANNSAVVQPPILPLLRLCKGVTGSGPYSCATQLNAADFSIANETASTGDYWQRFQATFTTGPAETSVDLAVVDAAGGVNGDDVQITQLGVQACGSTTAVSLMSLEATGVPAGVELTWRTGSELSNLGFHVHRAASEGGPWGRVTTSIIPGLGSSPIGASYSYLDSGLLPGQRYCYELEDVDTRSVSTMHGPVCTVPSSPGDDGEGGGREDGAERGRPGASSCPSWVLSAAPDAVSPVCARYGNPDAVSLHLLARDASSATVELRTGGFWTLRDASGELRVFVPGMEFPSDPNAPALPVRRALVEAVVGKGVELVSAEALDVGTFRGLRPSAVGTRELVVSRDGTVRPSRRSVSARLAVRWSGEPEVARLAGTVFQGERKSAVVEMSPVRLTGTGLELAGRVRVRLAFTGEVEGESGTGSLGRAVTRGKPLFPDVLARLHTSRRGLHALGFEQAFPGRPRGYPTRFLRLQRGGEAVAFHVEPATGVFGPGAVLYFHADDTVSSTEYSSEVAYELVRGRDGTEMGVGVATPAGSDVPLPSTGSVSFETNRIYQPGLLEAEDVWVWQAAVSSAAPARVDFSLGGVETSSGESARLVVHLQGASESGTTTDHHVRVLVNGVEAGEATFSGKKPYRLEATVGVSALKEGANELSLVNVGDTGVYSLVFLDRFEISYPQASVARGGVFEGEWSETGTVEVTGVVGLSPVTLRVPVILRGPGLPDPAEVWLTGFEATGTSVRFQAEAGYRYLVVSRESLLTPRVEAVTRSALKDRTNQADYLVIAPREFLEAAERLVERRQGQGLRSRAVSLEEIASEFGHGQASAEAIRSFLSHAYHSWRRPSPRYVLLLGDATYDPRRFVSTSWPSPLPALWTKTSYLWTASDPLLGAVNGEDALPDLAIGRLPATTREQAEALVAKVLSWEETGQDLGGNAVLVADNPDQGGDFEWDAEDVRSSYLSGRATTTLKLRDLGGGTRAAILGAFDGGVSLVSYVGHGGSAVWASENVLNTWDAPSLLAQSRQPVLLTMNCLNGYFVAPNFDALPEAFLKAEGRGVVAAVSPSGLSLDGPAHAYHRALMGALTSGRHERLGDAVLAAQGEYAATGLMPELLTVYQLLGDPATRVVRH